MLQFCSVSNSLSHTTLSNKVRGIFFLKELCRSLLLCRRYDSACVCRCISIICLYSWSWLYNTVILIVISTFGMVPRSLERGLEELESVDEPRPSKLQHCWDRLEYWEESQKPKETCCLLDSSERPSANAGVKSSQRVCWNLTKRLLNGDVDNEMENFITLTKYNICQRREEVKPLLVVTT